jgi:hypothetical protein
MTELLGRIVHWRKKYSIGVISVEGGEDLFLHVSQWLDPSEPQFGDYVQIGGVRSPRVLGKNREARDVTFLRESDPEELQELLEKQMQRRRGRE